MGTYESYEQYFATNHYDSRYPRPNRRSLEIAIGTTSPGATIIDVGAGNGRYALPLAQLGYHVEAVERSEAARFQLIERAASFRMRGSVRVHADLGDVDPSVLAVAPTAMLMFGVLGHMSFDERSQVLRSLAATMSPDAALVGSVPNRLRRFRREQRTSRIADSGEAPRFEYRRSSEGEELVLEYSAFSPSELRDELLASGWQCDSLSPESLLPEAAVTGRAWVGTVDAAAASRLPAWTGHCIFFRATNGGAALASAAAKSTSGSEKT